MGKYILLILLSVFTYGISKAQDIPKKANNIVITNSLYKDQLYDKVIEILFDNGYGIQNGDKASAIITTTNKPYKNGSVKLNFMIRDNKVSVRGNFYMAAIELYGVTTDSPSIIDYRGMKNSPAMNAWNEMSKIADLIPGTKEYLIK